MYLSLKKEFEDFRLTVTSNRMSSTFYLEQLPKYVFNEKVKIFSLYFYFHGNLKLNIRELLDVIVSFGDSYTYEGIKAFILDFCSEGTKGTDFSFSEKETSCFNVKPKENFNISVKGTDFVGSLFWNKFIFYSDKGSVLETTDEETAKTIFKAQACNDSFLSGKSYENLIKVLKSGKCHFSEKICGRR